MIIPVIRELATRYSKIELENAAIAFENERSNVFDVKGKDEGEILTNLLIAVVVRDRMETQGMSLQDALREHSRSVQNLLTKKKPAT